MPGPLTRAVTGTREPPTSGLVLGAQVPGPDVQGLSPAPARPGGQNSQRHGPRLSWAQAREPSLFLPTGWGWGTQDPSFPETQDGGSGEASSTRGPLHGPPHPSAGTQRPPTDRASPTCSSETFVTPLLPSSEPPSLALHQEPRGHHSGQPSLPRNPSRNHCAGQYWLCGTQPVGGGAPGWRSARPQQGGGGGSWGGGGRGLPSPRRLPHWRPPPPG